MSEGATDLTTFMVERYLPAVPYRAFEQALERAVSAAAAMTVEGVSVRYLGSLYVPEEECSFCCFEALDGRAVGEVNRRAGVPFWRIARAELITREKEDV